MCILFFCDKYDKNPFKRVTFIQYKCYNPFLKEARAETQGKTLEIVIKAKTRSNPLASIYKIVGHFINCQVQ